MWAISMEHDFSQKSEAFPKFMHLLEGKPIVSIVHFGNEIEWEGARLVENTSEVKMEKQRRRGKFMIVILKYGAKMGGQTAMQKPAEVEWVNGSVKMAESNGVRAEFKGKLAIEREKRWVVKTSWDARTNLREGLGGGGDRSKGGIGNGGRGRSIWMNAEGALVCNTVSVSSLATLPSHSGSFGSSP